MDDPVAQAWGYLGQNVSNNVAEYIGLLEVLQQAERSGAVRICAQVDSQLVERQVNAQWACRNHGLQPLLEGVWCVLERMRRAGVHVIVEHIYREYNTVADALANHAVDTRSNGPWTLQLELGRASARLKTNLA